MPYENLSDYLAQLQDDGELRRVSVEVSPVLEVTEILQRAGRGAVAGAALFFEQMRGSPFPLVVNLLGSSRRICRALGVKTLDEISSRTAALLKPEAAESWLQRLKPGNAGVPATAGLTQVIRTGACQQVVKVGRDVDLAELPALQAWPDESGRAITAGQIFIRDPDSGARYVETFPLEIRGPNSLAVHWHRQHASRRVFAAHGSRGTQMPVAIAIGGDPLLQWLARAPLPIAVDPLSFAAAWMGKTLDLVKCRQFDLEVPAAAEFVLEGYLDATESPEWMGPLAQATGFYSEPEPLPLMHVTALTHRSNPVYVASVATRPAQEELGMQQAGERMLLPLLRNVAPEIVDFHVPPAGVGQALCVVSIRKTYPQQARKVLHAVWGCEQTMLAKLVIVVDEQVNVRDLDRVWGAVGANVHPGRDVVSTEGPAAHSDHAAPARGIGHKLGLDATPKLPEEGHPRPWPDELRMSPEIRDLVNRRWADYKLG